MKTFSERVVDAVLSIPKGRVSTYGRIARACGAGPMASQSITSILGKASESGVKNIPFHRIVYANGKVFTDERYDAKRMKLYKEEGIVLDKKGKIEDFENIVFEF